MSSKSRQDPARGGEARGDGVHLIRNYGLFWRRDQVEWRRNGELLGRGVRAKKQGIVDFAKQRGVYALYDDAFRLVYFGQAGKGARTLYPRLRSHNFNVYSERWSRFSWFGVVPVEESPGGDKNALRGLVTQVPDERTTNTKSILDHIEAVVIMTAEPLLNRKGGIFGKDVRHYRQVTLHDDPRLAEVEEDEEFDEDI